MRQYANQQGWTILEEYLEAGISGRTTDRPELLRMLARCHAQPHVDVVLVHKLDRLARNLADHLAIRSALAQEGVKLASATESLDDSVSGQLVERILATLSEFYAANLSEEVRKGLTERVRQGGWPHLHPVGYRRGAPDLAGRRPIELDPVTAPTVRRAFELMATGEYQNQQIVEWLREHQVSSSREGIRRLLTNPFYCGRLRWKGQSFRGLHPALISTQLFDQVQEQVRRRRRTKGSNRVLPLLHGFALCAQCGMSVGSEDHSGRTYYRCRGSFKNPRCRAKYSNSTAVHASLFNVYKRLPCTLGLRRHLHRLVKERADSERRRLQWCADYSASDRLQQARALRSARALADGNLDPNVYRRLVEEGRDRPQPKPNVPSAHWLPQIQSASTVWDLQVQLRHLEHQRALATILFERIEIDYTGVKEYALRRIAA